MLPSIFIEIALASWNTFDRHREEGSSQVYEIYLEPIP
jgi:hypothetical protein